MTESFSAARSRGAEVERAVESDPAAFRVLTGDRPTGKLHIGHYFGSLQNRVRLQRLGVELFVLVADYQVLTDRDVTEAVDANVEALLLDYLAVGIDPGEAVLFAHSAIPALNQLLLPFLSLVTVAELRRNPTVKEEITASRQSSVSGLMFTYPVHQAADILFCHANLVPVGKDQLPHLELTRLVARRFNERYGTLFAEPDALLSKAPSLLGTDGQKMSKSRNNAIPISATADETAALIRGAKTDSERDIHYDPGSRPEVSSLLLLAALCQDREPEAVASDIGGGGAGALKAVVTESVNEYFRPIRQARAGFAADPAQVRDILRRGNNRATEVAESTLADVRELMGMNY
ncbi:tryptophan--tRNA ligase [Prauserella marina]|uniref:Tryptophan--tRNA ligase n=1 Tax=Prauserella marina TaxID=530584 RepID=A0A222VVW4_9PSEU|nr:tryptophan--tRNA ligase [Prauserella marina]ASR37863.1 tryptophan--tRNA ligase [Prauserella marina]PWV73062.1 tryptophanyl-tRNA synthetase [Prauserella marina]SDD72849.1 tryptophanyl-tRNA synthetase [Prauserella marina]